MKIEFHTKGVIITAKQKSLMQKKLLKVKKYIPDEELIVDVILCDETSPEKGGIDQVVKLSATFGKEKVYIEEANNRLMRAFAIANKRFDRKLQEFHREKTDRNKKTGGLRWEKVMGVLRIKGKKKVSIQEEEQE